MAAAIPILLLTFLLAAATPSAGPSYVIKTTCAAVTNATVGTPYRYCLRTLSANPAAAATKDARGLAIAATNLTATNVTSTELTITRLIDALYNCLATYQSMQASIAGALQVLNAGRFDVASPKLRDASFQPDFCELAMMESDTDKDPMSDENSANYLVSGMAYNIAELIARHAAK
ncbi:hypothetical protein TRIUR3_19789 [Triticum urartu]|uniref:Pectinesterase inhibitor domain-containing protein n=1 Tax=Triticum urartu TaxID=4572 RepID=M7YGV6_TRIUA|nr:hypothetical protein TRIUR3_19789 [Triticum urartu]